MKAWRKGMGRWDLASYRRFWLTGFCGKSSLICGLFLFADKVKVAAVVG